MSASAVCLSICATSLLPSLIEAADAPPPVAQLFAVGAGTHEGQGVAAMANGTIVATGQFQGTATFGAATLTSGGSFDYYLSAYDPQGQPLWAKGAGALGADFGQKVIVDRAGNIVVVGTIQGPADFHGTAFAGFGGQDWFVAKYSAAGELLWVRFAGSSAADQAADVAEDGAGNYYVSGRVRGVAEFGNGVSLGVAAQTRVILAKYDATGGLQWARDVAPTDSAAGSGVAADADGNAFVAGLTQNDGAGPFLAKYDAGGTRSWIWVAQTGFTFFEEGSGVDLDASGNIYLAGRFSAASLVLGATTLSNPNGAPRGFIAKFDPTGAPVWGIKGGARAFDVDVEPDGTMYATGFFNANGAEIGGVTPDTAGGTLLLYTAKISTAGQLLWVKPSETWQNGIGRAIAHRGPSTFVIGEGGQELYDAAAFRGGVYIAEFRETASGPSLSAALLPDSLQLAWPAEFTGYSIETAAAIDGTFGAPTVVLTPVAGQPNTFTTPRPDSTIFFRLRK